MALSCVVTFAMNTLELKIVFVVKFRLAATISGKLDELDDIVPPMILPRPTRVFAAKNPFT